MLLVDITSLANSLRQRMESTTDAIGHRNLLVITLRKKRNRYETDNALRDTEQTENKKEETILTRTNGRKKLPQLETELTNPNNVFVKRKSSSRDSNANIVKCISINN